MLNLNDYHTAVKTMVFLQTAGVFGSIYYYRRIRPAAPTIKASMAAAAVFIFLKKGLGFNETVLLFLTLIGFILMYRFPRQFYNQKTDKRILIIFLLNTIALLSITIFFRIGMAKPDVRLDLIRLIATMNKYDVRVRIRHLFENIIMLIPSGWLLQKMTGGKNVSPPVVMWSILFSLCAESTQLIFALGECDVLDLIGNGIGGWIGAVIACMI